MAAHVAQAKLRFTLTSPRVRNDHGKTLGPWRTIPPVNHILSQIVPPPDGPSPRTIAQFLMNGHRTTTSTTLDTFLCEVSPAPGSRARVLNPRRLPRSRDTAHRSLWCCWNWLLWKSPFHRWRMQFRRGGRGMWGRCLSMLVVRMISWCCIFGMRMRRGRRWGRWGWGVGSIRLSLRWRCRNDVNKLWGKIPIWLKHMRSLNNGTAIRCVCNTDVTGLKIIVMRKVVDSRYFQIRFSWRICILVHNVTSFPKKHSNTHWHTVLLRRTRNRSTISSWINPIHLAQTLFHNGRRLWRSWFQEDWTTWNCTIGIVIVRDDWWKFRVVYI